jgi:hypothetical protein
VQATDNAAKAREAITATVLLFMGRQSKAGRADGKGQAVKEAAKSR